MILDFTEYSIILYPITLQSCKIAGKHFSFDFWIVMNSDFIVHVIKNLLADVGRQLD